MQQLKKTERKSPVMSKRKNPCRNISFVFFLLPVAGLVFILSSGAPPEKKIKTGTLKLIFKHTVNGASLVLLDSLYTNVFGETYRVSKFKYYISNTNVKNAAGRQKERSGYHLVDATSNASLSFDFAVKAGKYDTLFFLLGVDSARNCSGAQAGALDPMNDMFWTWNSGYVMAKLEGASTSSSSINQRMEYHIGGYKNSDNVIQQISLGTHDPILILTGKTTEVIIETDLSKWWQAGNPVSIKETPICTTPGNLAKKIAVNYRNMFTIQSIRNY